jgi:hypothetical protein
MRLDQQMQSTAVRKLDGLRAWLVLRIAVSVSVMFFNRVLVSKTSAKPDTNKKTNKLCSIDLFFQTFRTTANSCER